MVIAISEAGSTKLQGKWDGSKRSPDGAVARITGKRNAPRHSTDRQVTLTPPYLLTPTEPNDKTPLKPQATYDDFARPAIRIGKGVDVRPLPRARNPSYKVGVDVGADRIMWSSAQITNYEPAALV